MSYILRYTGKSLPDTEAVKKILDDNNIRILDSSSLPKMILVDNIEDNRLPEVKMDLQEWEFFPQKTSFKVPDTRPKVSK